MIVRDVIVEDMIAGTHDRDEIVNYILQNVPGCLRILGMFRDEARGRTVAYVNVIESPHGVNITRIQFG